MIRRPPRSTRKESSAASDVYKRQTQIWPKLNCKIFATPFTAALVVEKFREKNIDITTYLNIVQLNGKINLENFEIDFITLTHSILEPNGLRIKTPLGNVLHTGDWKCDPDPLIGKKIDSDKLKLIGKEGVLTCLLYTSPSPRDS